MLSNKIIDAAFSSLFGNLFQALKISLVPLIIGFGVFLVLNWPVIQTLLSMQGGTLVLTWPQMMLVLIGILAIAYAATFAAVRWHCFRLGVPFEWREGFLRPVLYFLFMLVVAIAVLLLLLVVLGVPAASVLGSFEINIGNFGPSLARGWPHVLLNAVGTFAFAFLFLRWAPLILVSIAIGDRDRDRRWTTKIVQRELLQIAALYTVATFLWSLIGGFSPLWYLTLVVDLVLFWIAFMLSIAILTEIYSEVRTRMQGPVPDAA